MLNEQNEKYERIQGTSQKNPSFGLPVCGLQPNPSPVCFFSFRILTNPSEKFNEACIKKFYLLCSVTGSTVWLRGVQNVR